MVQGVLGNGTKKACEGKIDGLIGCVKINGRQNIPMADYSTEMRRMGEISLYVSVWRNWKI